jgi:SPX domain protein involved in polyphosphate accumulation
MSRTWAKARHSRYTVRPLLQVRLRALPFNSEDYSNLLQRYIGLVVTNLDYRHCTQSSAATMVLSHLRSVDSVFYPPLSAP